MSYNNYLDASSALETCDDFSEPTAVVVKHNSPCGVASSSEIHDALKNAINADRESAYGSVICVNREFNSKAFTARRLLRSSDMEPDRSISSSTI